MHSEVYEGEVLDVYSGDDLIAMVDLGVDDLFKRRRIRLHGVDAPNGIGASSHTEAGKVRAYVRNLCEKKRVRLTVVSKNLRSWVAVVEVLADGKAHNINQDLIAQGYKFVRETHNDR